MRLALALASLAACACAASRPPAALPTSPLPVPPPAQRASAAGERPDPPFAPAVDAVFAPYASGHVPGCAVGVYRAGAIAFARGYGYADLEHDGLACARTASQRAGDARIGERTPFVLASLSKQFTAAAVMLLVQQGKVSLDDDVRKYVPELPDWGKRVTIAQLLHHTSGVRDYGLLLDLQGIADEDLFGNDDVLWLLARQRGLNFAPGTRYLYSNSGYVLLSTVVSRVAGEPLGAFLEARVFGPLGMRYTFVKDSHSRIVPGRAVGYAHAKDGSLRVAMSDSETTGSTNVVSTIDDLAKWDGELYAPSVGGQALVDAMRVTGKLADGTPIDYAAGLVEGETHGLRRESHAGATLGYRTAFVRYPEERVAVTVLCNDMSADAPALADRVAAVLIPRLAEPEARAKPAPPATPPAPVETPPPAKLAEYAGRYGGDELPRDVVVTLAGDTLTLGALGVPRTRTLRPKARDAFETEDGGLTCTFVRDRRGKVDAVVFDSVRTQGIRLRKER